MSDDAGPLWICSYGSHEAPDAHPGTLSVWDGTEVVAQLPLDPAPSYGAFSADGDRLYLACEGARGRLVTLDPAAVLAGRGAAAVLDEQSSGGADACHLQLSPSGSRLAVANYCAAATPDNGGVLAIYTLDGHGLPTRPRLLRLSGSGPDPDRQPGPHAHQATWLTEDRLLLCDLGTDSVLTIAVDGSDGTPRPVGRAGATPGSGPRHLAVHPSGALVLAEELTGTVSLWEPDNLDGDSGYRQVARVAVLADPAPAGAGFPSAVRLTGDGRYAHVAVRGPNVVSTLEITPGGAEPLRLLGSVGTGGDWPRDLLVDGSGDEVALWVANQGSSTVTCGAFDGVTGLIGEPAVRIAIAHPNWLSRRPRAAGSAAV